MSEPGSDGRISYLFEQIRQRASDVVEEFENDPDYDVANLIRELDELSADVQQLTEELRCRS